MRLMFPADDATLIARGRYATVASERRARLRELRDHAEAMAENARRIIRFSEKDYEFAHEQADAAFKHAACAMDLVDAIEQLSQRLDELRPAAWANVKEEIE